MILPYRVQPAPVCLAAESALFPLASDPSSDEPGIVKGVVEKPRSSVDLVTLELLEGRLWGVESERSSLREARPERVRETVREDLLTKPFREEGRMVSWGWMTLERGHSFGVFRSRGLLMALTMSLIFLFPACEEEASQ